MQSFTVRRTGSQQQYDFTRSTLPQYRDLDLACRPNLDRGLPILTSPSNILFLYKNAILGTKCNQCASKSINEAHISINRNLPCPKIAMII